MNKPSICYLCGELLSESSNKDHIPPKQFFADEIRQKHNPNLITLPVHKDCNRRYQLDEEYFVTTLLPFMLGSYSGNARYYSHLRKYREGKKQGLVKKMLSEFDPRPSGLFLPGGKVIKRFDVPRVSRVAWKIVRGLYFCNLGKVLPENIFNGWEALFPWSEPSENFLRLISTVGDEPGKGNYSNVFDYKFKNLIHNWYVWALLFWEKIVMITIFEYPFCYCDDCKSIRAQFKKGENVQNE